jgi:hypothetical protein
MNWTGCASKGSFRNLRYYYGICLEELRKLTVSCIESYSCWGLIFELTENEAAMIDDEFEFHCLAENSELEHTAVTSVNIKGKTN